MFSVGVIYSTKNFLDHIQETSLTPKEFEDSFAIFNYSDPEKVLELSFHCRWVFISPKGIIQLTDRGNEIVSFDLSEALFLQLEDMIYTFNPQWASLLPKGREETKNFLPKNVLQCFNDANLFGTINDNIIKCWDRLALAYRNYNHQKLLESGRDGEKLSVLYEEKRTKTKPLWQSIESNLSGFDILSKVDENDLNPLRIEVKSTVSKMKYASFHISKNEWKVSQVSDNYIFHLWDLKNKTLYITQKSIIEPHIPNDNGNGDWREVKIPFKDIVEHGEIIESSEFL